jgi:hypothetical protein
MLELTLETPSHQRLATAEIANVAEVDGLADYAVCVYDAADDLVGMAMLHSYARWSAPAHDLVLRAVCLALYGEERIPTGRLPFADARMPPELVATLHLVPPFGPSRSLGRWWLTRCVGSVDWAYKGEEPDAPTQLFTIDTALLARRGMWAVVLTMWCRQLTRGTDVGPRRPRVHLPIHEHKGLHFVRLNELPRHMRLAFEHAHKHSTCPCIPGVMDAYYAHDLVAFLGYSPGAPTVLERCDAR